MQPYKPNNSSLITPNSSVSEVPSKEELPVSHPGGRRGGLKPERKKLTKCSEYSTIEARGPMLDKVYSLRYLSYSDGGYIDDCRSQKFIDEYDARANCNSYLTYFNGKNISSIRACFYEPNKGLEVPAMEIFGDEIASEIGYDTPFVELNKFVIDPGFHRRGGVKARFHIMGAMVEQATIRGSVYVLIAVRTSHVKFYRMLGCKPISEEKVYPKLNFGTVLLASDALEYAQKILSGRT